LLSFEKACTLDSPANDYDSSNVVERDRVFQELLRLGDIQPWQTDEEIRITRQGADKPEYQPPDNLTRV